jgi:predicted TIM-barrel fold metal-dependent hydrolase
MTDLTVHGVPVVDVDSHYTEPADLWTSRAPAKYRDVVPHVESDDKGRAHWIVGGGIKLGPLGYTVIRNDGSKQYGVLGLPSFEEMTDAASDPAARLKMLDEVGISQQIIYPNVAGLASESFTRLDDVALRNHCARSYNDAIAELQAVGAGRLFPQAVVPFWDLPEAIAELRRVKDLGLTGFVMCDTPEAFGLPYLNDPHWAPFWETAQELEFPVNFHIGAGVDIAEKMVWKGYGRQRYLAAMSVSLFIGQFRTVMNLILSGLLERYPRLNFVSVESGIGWVPFVLEALEWQFDESMPDEREGLTMRPTEYFRRQIYTSFWFETFGPSQAIERIGEDNVMFETDFPHPTCLYPGAREHVRDVLAGVEDHIRRKVLHDTAQRIYHLPEPD